MQLVLYNVARFSFLQVHVAVMSVTIAATIIAFILSFSYVKAWSGVSVMQHSITLQPPDKFVLQTLRWRLLSWHQYVRPLTYSISVALLPLVIRPVGIVSLADLTTVLEVWMGTELSTRRTEEG